MLKCELDVMEYAVTEEEEFFAWFFGTDEEEDDDNVFDFDDFGSDEL